MERRAVLRSAASLVTAAAALRATASHAAPTQTERAESRREAGPYMRTRDGQSLFYKDWGRGAPMVFLAAWALPSDMWDYQMVPLSEQGRRCVAYDRRGHGKSSHPGGGYDYDVLADDLAAVLDGLDLREVTLVGMSMAAGEMVRYVTRHGTRRIARLAFVATAATPFRTMTADNTGAVPAERIEPFRRNMAKRD